MNSLFNVKNLNFVITGGLGQIGLKLSEYLEKNGSNIVKKKLFFFKFKKYQNFKY